MAGGRYRGRGDKIRQASTQVVQKLLTPGYRDLESSELRQVRSQQITKLDHSHSEKKINLIQRRSAKGQGPKQLAKEGN